MFQPQYMEDVLFVDTVGHVVKAQYIPEIFEEMLHAGNLFPMSERDRADLVGDVIRKTFEAVKEFREQEGN